MPWSENKRFVKGALFSSTALALMMADADATPFVEGSCPGGEPAETMGSACELPDGTTSVSGFIDAGEGDPSDWYKFNNLVPGSTFEVTLTTAILDGANVRVRDQAGVAQFLLTFQGDTNSFVLGGLDTMTFLEVFDAENGGNYDVGVTATFSTAAPEPASAALLGVGAAGLAGLRRRKTATQSKSP